MVKSDEYSIELPATLPLFPLRDIIVFPTIMMPLIVGREKSLKAIESAMDSNRIIATVAQKNSQTENPSFGEIYSIGCAVRIVQILKLPDGSARILAEGISRIRIKSFEQEDPFLIARITPIHETDESSTEIEALMRSIKETLQQGITLGKSISPEVLVSAINAETPGKLADLIATHLNLKIEERQQILETIPYLERLKKVNLLLAKELEVLMLENKIQTEAKQEFEKSHREYVLREQLKVLQKELGTIDSAYGAIDELKEKIEKTPLSKEAKEAAVKEVERLERMPSASPESVVSRTYLDWLLSLPWGIFTSDTLDIKQSAKVLDEDHYDLTKVKERILEHLAVRKLKENMKGPILCFMGPPGVGKTSLGKSIARALGRNFTRISLGGIHDEAEIRGHRRTYIGSLPGRIIEGIKKAGSLNPVFMLDEIDKVGTDFRGDPSAALLEALDPEQNHSFSDHYLDVPFDLSNVMFITTANILDPVPPALRDRMETIEIPGYTEYEKIQIAQRHIIPKQLDEHGLVKFNITFSEKSIRRIITEYTKEAGLRNMERNVASIFRKIAKNIVEGRKNVPASIGENLVVKFLGPRKFHKSLAEKKDEIGVATGLAWTEAGGDILSVEVTRVSGKGKLTLTGQLGEVMKESAHAALSFVRRKFAEYGIEKNFANKYDIHIHVPAGAIPKDGPSAGITIATALVSDLTNRPVDKTIAMTGEITLRGRVLPVGGIKEKVLSAHRSGIKTVIMPKENKNDLTDVPAEIKKSMKFVFVENTDKVIKTALKKKSKRS